MKRKGKQMVTAVLSTVMLFTMSSMPCVRRGKCGSTNQ